MKKWKIFAFLSIITLMTLFVRAGLCTLYLPLLQAENSVEKEVSYCVSPHAEHTASKAIDYLISNRKAPIPQTILFIQTQKSLDGKFFLIGFNMGEDFFHRPPLSLNLSHSTHSKHPYTHLNRTYYLYTLKKILI